MVDLRDPRFMNVNDIADALCSSIIDPIQLAIGNCMLHCHLEVEFKSSWNLSFVIPSFVMQHSLSYMCGLYYSTAYPLIVFIVIVFGSIVLHQFCWINFLLQLFLDQLSFAIGSIFSCRADSYPFMGSIWPTALACIAYVYFCKVPSNPSKSNLLKTLAHHYFHVASTCFTRCWVQGILSQSSEKQISSFL